MNLMKRMAMLQAIILTLGGAGLTVGQPITNSLDDEALHSSSWPEMPAPTVDARNIRVERVSTGMSMTRITYHTGPGQQVALSDLRDYSGAEPTGACCNDTAGTCGDGVRQLQCDGRWAVNVTCASNPFDPPCGTNACCTQFGCTDTTRAICDTFSGSIIPNVFCNDFDHLCPRNECLGADGSCQEANGTPGCEDAFCCAAVCAIDQRCCTLGWDNTCTEEAGRECVPPAPPNDHCGNARIISGTGEFGFDNGTATTDGPLHEACIDLRGETHITDDVWYCWTAPCTDTVSIRTCGLTAVDTKIAVYDGCDTCLPGDAALLGCNDDFCGIEPQGRQSQVSFSATEGQSYLIRIGTFPGAPGGIGGLAVRRT